MRADTLEDTLRWSGGMELLRPVIDLIDNQPDAHFMRLEGFVQRWVRPDIAARISVTYATEYEATEEPPFITDTTKVTRYATQESTDLRFGGGVLIQKRQEAFVERTKHFAPLLGITLLMGRQDRSITDEDQGYFRDSVGVAFEPVPGTDVVSSRTDRMFYMGFDLSPGLSGRLGGRWEIEMRLPIEATWWSTLGSTTVNYPDVPDWWDQPVNVGIRWPRLFLHYRW